MYSSGRVECILFVKKDNLWVLFRRQSEQENCFIESETGNEKCETTDFKIREKGWPSLECQEDKEVLGVGEA